MTYGNLARMAFGYTTSQILYSAVRMGLPDALSSGPVPVEKLAASFGCDTVGMSRLVRALVVLGVLYEVAPDQVELAELGRPLCAEHPRSIRASLLLLGNPAIWRAWGGLADAVRTGTPAFDDVHGQPLFDHLAGDPMLSDIFNTAMREGTTWVAAAAARAYDFSKAGTVVDIGGGNGTLLAAVLAEAPTARGILFDTAEGVAGAAARLHHSGVADRTAIEVGDFFETVPAGDVLILKGVLHDWDDERCLTVLRRCRQAVATGGRLLVLEPVLPDRLDTPQALGVVMSDIAMLVYTGGRERSRDEFAKLLTAAGFALVSVSPPLGGSSVRLLQAQPRS